MSKITMDDCNGDLLSVGMEKRDGMGWMVVVRWTDALDGAGNAIFMYPEEWDVLRRYDGRTAHALNMRTDPNMPHATSEDVAKCPQNADGES